MTETYARFTVNKKYTQDAQDVSYLGVYGVNYVFGFTNVNLMDTAQQPFYITIGDDGVINEVPAPMIQDDYYDESMFARYEARFHYFELNNLLA